VSVFVENSVKNSTFMQKETNRSVALKVNLILTLMGTLFLCLCKLSFNVIVCLLLKKKD
jgi:hypothetical protein